MPRKLFEVRDALDQARQAKRRLEEEAGALRARVDAGHDDDGTRERLSNLRRGVERRDVEIAELEGEAGQAMAEGLRRGEMAEMPGADFGVPEARTRPTGPTDAQRSEAMRAIERAHRDGLTDYGAERLEDVAERDQAGIDRRLITAGTDPDYRSAFVKSLVFGTAAPLHMSDRERAAFHAAQEASRAALAVAADATGGALIPLMIDPSLIPPDDAGSANPLRELATVQTINTTQVSVVTAENVTVTWGAEASDVDADEPTFVPNPLVPERLSVYITASLESVMDIPSIVQDLSALLADAKNEAEALAFAMGAGHASNEPEGIAVGGTTVTTASTNAFAIADVTGTQEALGPRYQAGATWVMPNAVHNMVTQMVAAADTSNAPITDAAGNVLGKQYRELSTLDDTVSSGKKIAAYGDFRRGFRIVDRLGSTLETIQNVVNPTTGVPTGQRGFVYYSRVTSGVVVPGAIQVVTVKS